MCDESEERGLFWLTGSQQYNMMKNIRETMAGRIGILELYSLSKNEVEGLTFPNELDFSLPCLLARQPLTKKNDIVNVFEHIWRGVCRMCCTQMQSKGRNTLIPILKPILCGMCLRKEVLPIQYVSENF